MKKITQQEFIEQSQKTHNNKYDYSKTVYVNMRTPVVIICPIHGEFKQSAKKHKEGQGCPICGNSIKKTTEQFINEAKSVHGDKYDYSKVNYKNNCSKIEIVCKTHGSFFQIPKDHLNGSGCLICAGKQRMTTDVFIKKAENVHGDKYDYSKINYKNNYSKVEIICPIHGSYFQRVNNHLSGHGCPICNSSKGEKKIADCLTKKGFVFEQQKRFADCKDVLELPFDFYLPNNNLLIEFDGIQHFEPVEHFGPESFEITQKHDKIKNDFAKQKNIQLLRIRYDQDIDLTLDNYFCDYEFDSRFFENIQDLADYIYKYENGIDGENTVEYFNNKYTPDFLPLFKKDIPFPWPEFKNSDSGLIRYFHKSIFEAHVGKNKNALEVWNDKNVFYKLAKNRLKYIGKCDLNSMRQGLNIAKIAPKVSVFKPSLATNLIKTYLSDCEIVFDPFSGFSGRLLGAINNSKIYIGQDINQKHVNESNEIINYKKYSKATISCVDVFQDSEKEFDCLFTCPPYNLKEVWNENETDLSCDEWIDICLAKYKCKKYLFVVDKTEKYQDFVVQEISNQSHFGKNSEKVIFITGKN